MKRSKFAINHKYVVKEIIANTQRTTQKPNENTQNVPPFVWVHYRLSRTIIFVFPPISICYFPLSCCFSIKNLFRFLSALISNPWRRHIARKASLVPHLCVGISALKALCPYFVSTQRRRGRFELHAATFAHICNGMCCVCKWAARRNNNSNNERKK